MANVVLDTSFVPCRYKSYGKRNQNFTLFSLHKPSATLLPGVFVSSSRALDGIPEGIVGTGMACDFFMTLLPYFCCEHRVLHWQVLCCCLITLRLPGLAINTLLNFPAVNAVLRYQHRPLLTLALLCQSTLAKTKCKTKFQLISFNRAMLDVPLSNRMDQARVVRVV